MKKPRDGSIRSAFDMVGIIHADREGKAVLEKWLEWARPDAVTCEFTRYGLMFRRRKGAELKSRAASAVEELASEGCRLDGTSLDALFSYIDLPWEFVAASDYCGRHGASLFLVDMHRFSSMHLEKADELFEKENLRALLSGPDRQGGRREKALARLFFEKGIKSFSYTEEMRVRDKHMSRRIARLIERLSPSRLVHICGWQHLGDPFGLYAALSPKKVFIHDKALCV